MVLIRVAYCGHGVYGVHMARMTPQQWRALVGSRIEARRKDRGITLTEAARRAGFSPSWWRSLESGERNDHGRISVVSPRPESLAGAARAIGWTPDSIERLKRGEEPVELEPDPAGVTVVTNHQMLAEILSEIRNHRASDIAPSAHLLDVPTRADLRAEIQAAVNDVFERVGEHNRALVEAVENLSGAVQAQEHRLRALEARVSEQPEPSPQPRKRSQATRT